jgi:hypothetical protein
MSVFWPTTLNPRPGLFGRLGRLLHWTGLGLACLMGGSMYVQAENALWAVTTFATVYAWGAPLGIFWPASSTTADR